MKTTRALAFAGGGIIAAVLSVAMLILFPSKDVVFWITYLFLLLSIAGTTMNAAFLKADNAHFASNLTLLTISIVYLLACVLASLVAGYALRVRPPVYSILHLVLFAIFLCLWLIARSAVSYINKQD